MKAAKPLKIDASVLREATTLRRDLHAHPEIANQEQGTARRIREFLGDHGLKAWRKNLGGHGLLFQIEGNEAGSRVLLRADLDALPIDEQNRVPHRSKNPGNHHACGHDGHMAMLAAALAQLSKEPEFSGTAYGLFQPAEETGEGAARVLADLGSTFKFDEAYAIHNYPGLPIGSLGVRTGTAAKPSMGLAIELTGRRTHASEPELGRNPIPTLGRVANDIQRQPTPVARRRTAFATIVGLDSGPTNYGVSPASARLALTLRGNTQIQLDRLRARILEMAVRRATEDRLAIQVRERDVFRETRNHPHAVRRASDAARSAGLSIVTMRQPLSASEDFGRFTERAQGALLLLGAGRTQAPLHSAGYDFPETILDPGARLWLSLLKS
ncbi:MAG TPA: amidohydrolase [Candidatus Thermoplasmatota archaeon]